MKFIAYFVAAIIPCILLYYVASSYFAARKFFGQSKEYPLPDFVSEGKLYAKGKAAASNTIFYCVVANILFSVKLATGHGVWAAAGWNVPLILALFLAYRIGAIKADMNAGGFFYSAQLVANQEIGSEKTFGGKYTVADKQLAMQRIDNLMIEPLCILNRCYGAALALLMVAIYCCTI